jgi:hypothetical protein
MYSTVRHLEQGNSPGKMAGTGFHSLAKLRAPIGIAKGLKFWPENPKGPKKI